MRSRRRTISLLKIQVDGSSEVPKHRQVYYGIRNAIWSGDVAVGDALPSSRRVARQLCVSRNTVMAAFEQLMAEGYVESKQGAGTFVAQSLQRTFQDSGEATDRKPA